MQTLADTQILPSGFISLQPGKHQDLLAAGYILRCMLTDESRLDLLYKDGDEALEVVIGFLVFDAQVLATFRRLLSKAEQVLAKEKDDAEFIREMSLYSMFSDVSIQVTLRRLAKRSPVQYRKLLQTSLEFIELTLAEKCSQGLDELRSFSQVFNLEQEERKLLEYLICKDKVLYFPGVLESFIGYTLPCALDFIAAMINVPIKQLHGLIDSDTALSRRGLLIADDDADSIAETLQMTDVMRFYLKQPDLSPQDLQKKIAPPLPAGTFTAAHFAHVQNEWDDLQACLQGAMACSAPGINILLYGQPGTCKTELAKGLVTALGVSGLEVCRQDETGKPLTTRQRIASMLAVQNMLGARRDVVLIFDEIEDLFGSGLDAGEELNFSRTVSKGWMTRALESNPIPVIWIANQIQQIDPAYLRRFQYHLRMKALPAQARGEMVESYFTGLPVSLALRQLLADTSDLTAGDLQSAAQFARLCVAAGKTGVLDAMVRRQLLQALQAGGRKVLLGGPAGSAGYDLQFLNLSMERPVAELVAAIKARGQGKLFLYGVPGTGKTCLANYLAQQMDIPVLRYAASDLLGMYVGETEAKIAAMFETASQDPCVLFLDEADSFFRSRANATRSWEVSQVNELLQKMEDFQGIFICATNLFQDLDPAVLRRFAFKIEFLPLLADQRLALFIRDALHGADDLLTNPMRQAVLQMDGLTPGDFQVVRQQNHLFATELSPDNWLKMLSKELAGKQQGKRSIGFCS